MCHRQAARQRLLHVASAGRQTTFTARMRASHNNSLDLGHVGNEFTSLTEHLAEIRDLQKTELLEHATSVGKLSIKGPTSSRSFLEAAISI